ncbi:hypothetical protein AB6A40_010082 [Gnathostoma spinigerum]|uniref:Secreted protein n=1 Tax=Gnathostoma spinigerum TaxID=75299 RepID=A0ABD6EU86_9BILA
MRDQLVSFLKSFFQTALACVLSSDVMDTRREFHSAVVVRTSKEFDKEHMSSSLALVMVTFSLTSWSARSFFALVIDA